MDDDDDDDANQRWECRKPTKRRLKFGVVWTLAMLQRSSTDKSRTAVHSRSDAYLPFTGFSDCDILLWPSSVCKDWAGTRMKAGNRKDTLLKLYSNVFK